MKLRTVLLAAGAMIAAVGGNDATIRVAARGGFFVGGQTVQLRDVPLQQRLRQPGMARESVDINGDYAKGAVYVEYTRLAKPKSPFPVVMVPGGGFSAAAFQDTPDGRPGWEWAFLQRGYSVYLVDAHRTGRSPWRRYPNVEAEEPSFRTNQFLWETFRIGPPGSYRDRKAYPDTLFPVRAFDELAKQTAPRFRLPPEEEASSYDAIIQRVCPCILLLHSAAGPAGMAAAQRWPELVKGVIAIEPSGGAPPGISITNLAPHIFVWGDHLDPHETAKSWSELREMSKQYEAKLAAAGARTRWIDLPAIGIKGNSHFPMLDSNSDQVARIVESALSQLAE